MSNLSNLVNKVTEDAEKEVTVILQDAEKKAEELIERRKLEANEKVAKMLERAEWDRGLTEEQIVFNATMRARDEQLKAKREVMENVFSMALERLYRLNEKEYIQFLKNQIQAIEWKGTEILVVPKDKRDVVKKANLPMKLSDEEVIESGFMLIDEQYIMNHSFESLLDFYREELELDIARVLFEK